MCLGTILLGTWFLLSLPRQEVVDTTLTGYRFSPEGKAGPAPWKFKAATQVIGFHRKKTPSPRGMTEDFGWMGRNFP